MGGGHAYPLEQMQSVSEWTRDHGLKRHLDGARFFNATVAAGYSPGKIGALFDSVTICFSKGLGAPMGAILAGSREDIHRARRVRKMLGGGCRQIGIIAASALYALDHHIDRLEKDHEKAKRFARGIAELEGISLLSPVPETNLVFFDIAPECGTAEEMKIRLERYGVQIGSSGKQRMRAVTHLDVSPDDITRAIDAVGKCVADTAPATEK
jgi:threonine aldolase